MVEPEVSLDTCYDNPFWQFALKTYQSEELQICSHRLQDELGLNVNLLLLCCWLAYAVEEVSHSEFTTACQSVSIWQKKVTEPLRAARSYLEKFEGNEWTAHFFLEVLKNEIASESYQEETLYNHFKDKQKPTVDKNETLALRYLYWLFEDEDLMIDKEIELRLEQFLNLAYSQID